MRRTVVILAAMALLLLPGEAWAVKKKKDPKIVQAVSRALDYLAREQRRQRIASLRRRVVTVERRRQRCHRHGGDDIGSRFRAADPLLQD